MLFSRPPGERNLLLLPIERFLRDAQFYDSFLVALYASVGLGAATTMAFQSVFMVTMLAAELPTAFFSDRWGKRHSLLLSALLQIFAVALLYFCRDFWGILVSEIIIGLSYAFSSGADTALEFETLRALGREKENLHRRSWNFAAGKGSLVLVMLLSAGIIALGGLWALVLAQLIIQIFRLAVTLFLCEPRVSERNRASLVAQEKESAFSIIGNFLFKNPSIRRVLPLAIVTWLGNWLVFWGRNLFLGELGFSEGAWGWLFAGVNAAALLAGLAVARWPAFFSSPKGALLAGFSPVFGFAGMAGCLFFPFSNSVWLIAAVFLAMAVFQLAHSFAENVIPDFIHQRAPKELQATAISSVTVFRRLAGVVIGPTFGWLLGAVDLATAFALTAGLLSAIVLPSFLLFRNRK